MDKKRLAFMLPFAGLAGLGLATLTPSQPGLTAKAQACSKMDDPGGGADCYCRQDDVTYTCSESDSTTKDKDGNVTSTTHSCSQTDSNCEC